MKKFLILVLIFVLIPSVSFAETENIPNGLMVYDFERPEIKTIEPIPSFSTFSLTADEDEYYSSKDKHYLPPVRNQGPFGNCWAFAATAVLEAYVLKHFAPRDGEGNPIYSDDYDFSESHLQYMASNSLNNPYGYETGTGSTTRGGMSQFAMPYFANDFGPVLEENDKYYVPGVGYSNLDTRDYSNTKDIPKSRYKVTEIELLMQCREVGDGIVRDENNEVVYDEYGRFYITWKYLTINDAKSLIKKNGAVTGSMYHPQQGEPLFNGNGEFYYCGMEIQRNHAITLVGWDDNVSADNFTYTYNGVTYTPVSDGAFIARNSWGTSATDDGYFYISYCDYNLFADSMSISKVEERTEETITYTHTPYYPFGISVALTGNDNDSINSYGNIYKKNNKDEKLKGVTFYGFGGYTYDVYLIDSKIDYSNGINFEQMNKQKINIEEENKDGIYLDNDGYYTVNLSEDNQITINNDEFAVMVAVNSDDGIFIPYEKDLTGFLAKTVASPGQSFCGSINSTGDFYDEICVDFEEISGENNAVVSQKLFWDIKNVPVNAITTTSSPYAEFEFANFTNEKGEEITSFNEGDTVYVVPALNGVNLQGKELICAGYNNGKLEKIAYDKIKYHTYESEDGDKTKNINVLGKNRFKFTDISPSWEFRFFIWDLDGLKPICTPQQIGK